MLLFPYWMVAVAVILLAGIIAVLFLTCSKRSKTIRIYDKKANDGKPKAAKKKAREDKSHLYPAKLQGDLRTCFQSYKTMFDKMDIPDKVYSAKKCTCVFGLEYVVLSHYIWRKGEILCFFPKWRDIALAIIDPAYISARNGRWHEMIAALAIPVDYIKYYETDSANGTTTVYYEDKNAKRYKTVFLDGGDKVFKRLFPEKASETVKRREYLGSYGNILEIDGRISQLKTKVEQGLISGHEYEIQKEYIMRNL